MPFIWNDDTFFDRISESSKYKKFFYLPFTASLFLWLALIGNSVHIVKVIMISLATAAIVYSVFDIFLKFPNFKVPDYYHPYAKMAIRIGQLILSLMGFCIIWCQIIQPEL